MKPKHQHQVPTDENLDATGAWLKYSHLISTMQKKKKSKGTTRSITKLLKLWPCKTALFAAIRSSFQTQIL
jgi:hypothetical protein